VRRVRGALLCGVAALAASLALARVHPFGDAGLYAVRDDEKPILNRGQVPEAVRAILVEKCADCHSNQTRAPLYGRLAPASWLMERDIAKARDAMNFSEWENYPAVQQETLAAKMVQETRTHAMPLLQYRAIHWNARIDDGDVRVLAGWARALARNPSGPAPGAIEDVADAGNAVRGKGLFEKRCTGCHALTTNHEGPRLLGVYGRRSGTAEGFAYSRALKKAGIVWDDSSLEKWLADPDAFIAGNEMDFLVAKAQERRDLISYLRGSSGK
jgi:cytochrome c